jgi:hypothetical protein
MPASLIICCAGRPAINGPKRRTFLWVDKYGCFVHEGREMDETEFNTCVQSVMLRNKDLKCFAKVVSSDGAASVDPRIADLEKKLADKQARLEAVQASLIVARTATEPTLEQALAVVEALAPDRIKKKPGRKPAELLEV